MNDNYENEIFEEEEELEEKKGLSEKTIKILLGVVIVALVAVVIVAVALFGSGSGEETTTSPEETTVAEEITTDPANKYAPGQYTVNVGESQTLNFRKSFEKDSEVYTEAIPNGKELTITEVKYIPTADEAFRYMGKTIYPVNYENCEGWVAMYYLTNAYSESVVTPGEITTEPEQTTADPEQTTAAPEQTTAASEQTTAASEQTTAAPVQETTSSQSTAGKPTTVGTYTVDVDPNPGHVRMRKEHNISSENITLIPVGAQVTVVDVYEDANASDQTLKYWGKVTYAGYTGWVAMWYLK